MVPSVVVEVKALPLTATGKVDRRGLPEVEERGGLQQRYVAPQTGTEAGLAQIWSEVLKVEQVGVEDNFFELGGHSLLATQVVARVRERMGVELPLQALFDGVATLGELARKIDGEGRPAPGMALPPLKRRIRTGAVPLSYTQERLWFLEQFESLGSTYNEFLTWSLHGVLDMAALNEAWRK